MTQLEDVIQRKLIEESANELAATGKGEVEVVARIQKQEAALTETEQQVGDHRGPSNRLWDDGGRLLVCFWGRLGGCGCSCSGLVTRVTPVIAMPTIITFTSILPPVLPGGPQLNPAVAYSSASSAKPSFTNPPTHRPHTHTHLPTPPPSRPTCRWSWPRRRRRRP